MDLELPLRAPVGAPTDPRTGTIGPGGTRQPGRSGTASYGGVSAWPHGDAPMIGEVLTPRRPGGPEGGSVSRRRIFTAAGATGVLLAGGAWLASARGAGAQGGAGGRTAGTAPRPLWTYKGDVFVPAQAGFNGGTALVKGQQGTLIALNLADGRRPRWTYQGISPSPTPPLVVSGAVVALGNRATVIGVDPVTGSESFNLDFGGEFQFDRILGSSGDHTITIEGLQFVQVDGGQSAATSSKKVILATDLQARRARIVNVSGEDTTIVVQPVILPGYFVYVDGLSRVTVRSTVSGNVLWSHRVGYEVSARPLVVGGTVFAAGDKLIALDLVTGKVRWQAGGAHGAYVSLGGNGQRVYCTDTGKAGVHAFDTSSGVRRWFRATDAVNVSAPLVATPRTVLVQAADNKDGFYAIGAADGRLLWRYTDGVDTGQNGWQLSHDGAGHLLAQHFDRVECLPLT